MMMLATAHNIPNFYNSGTTGSQPIGMQSFEKKRILGQFRLEKKTVVDCN